MRYSYRSSYHRLVSCKKIQTQIRYKGAPQQHGVASAFINRPSNGHRKRHIQHGVVVMRAFYILGFITAATSVCICTFCIFLGGTIKSVFAFITPGVMKILV